MELTYAPDGKKLVGFYFSDAPVVLMQGPRTSGKSTASCYKLLRNALEQPPGKDGIRRRRAYVIRPTYDQLDRTVLKTWLEQFPEERFGKLKRDKPRVHHIRLPGLDWEVVFLAIEDQYALGKLLSAESSDAWVNEFREQPRKLITDLADVVGRYPSPKTCHRPQIIADTNAPRSDHWFAYMSGQQTPPENATETELSEWRKPASWDIFIQPPALIEDLDDSGEVTGYRANPEAENLSNLGPDYYVRKVEGRTRADIRVNYLNKPALLLTGKPVWPTFREWFHVAKEPLKPVPGHPLIVGVDFGRNPAAVVGQVLHDRWRVLAELVARDTSAKEFAPKLRTLMATRFPDHDYMVYGDPKGQDMSQADDVTPYMMFQAAGITVRPAPIPSKTVNDIAIRIAAIEELLKEAPEGVPGFLVSPSCPRLIAAMAGDYHYAESRTAAERQVPLKNFASNVADAAQYMALGGGAGTALLQTQASSGRSARPIVQPQRERGWNRLRAFRR